MRKKNYGDPDSFYFTLSGEELCPIAYTCMAITSGMMNDKKNKDLFHLDDFYMKGYNQLTEELKKHDHHKPVDIKLDYEMSYSLLYVIGFAFTFFTVINQYPRKKRLIHESQEHESTEMTLATLKEKAGQLAYKLVEFLEYPIYGISILEHTFQIQVGEPLLDVDNKKTISVLKITEEKKIFIEWTIKLLGYLRFHYHFYDFSCKLKSNQFINIIDFNNIHDKYKKCKLGKEIPLTLFDTIMLYQCICLVAIVPESDAANFIGWKERMAKSKIARGKRVAKQDLEFLNGLNIFQKKHKNILKAMEKEHSGNPVFMEHIAKVSKQALREKLNS